MVMLATVSVAVAVLLVPPAPLQVNEYEVVELTAPVLLRAADRQRAAPPTAGSARSGVAGIPGECRGASRRNDRGTQRQRRGGYDIHVTVACAHEVPPGPAAGQRIRGSGADSARALLPLTANRAAPAAGGGTRRGIVRTPVNVEDRRRQPRLALPLTRPWARAGW